MSCPRPDITVSIVCHDSGRVLCRCLETLFKEASGSYSMEVYVIDNASTDGSAEMIKALFPSVYLIQNTGREGFSANHNKVLREGHGRYFLVLNDDTIILNGAIDALVRFADQHSDAGIVGPRTLNPDGTLQDTCVHYPNIWRKLQHVFIQRYSAYPLISYSATDHERPINVEWIRGSCLLVRREALDTVGLLDERFFLFYEEVDWCARMETCGWRNAYCPWATIIHIGKQTVQRVTMNSDVPTSIAIDAQMSLSELLYYDKHYPVFGSLLLRLFLVIYLPGRIVKTYVARNRVRAGDRLYLRRLLEHLLWLTTRSRRTLLQLGRVPGGVIPPQVKG